MNSFFVSNISSDTKLYVLLRNFFKVVVIVIYKRGKQLFLKFFQTFPKFSSTHTDVMTCPQNKNGWES